MGAAAVLVLALLVSVLPTVAPPAGAAPGDGGVMRITEWMYDGAGGEFVELTNVGDAPVDLAGWSYDDDSATPGGFDLSGLGVVAAGESVVFAETGADAFRSAWGLCAGTKVVGPYTNNLGRADQINIFDGTGTLVDRLTYGDQVIAGSIRTQGVSGWVTAAGLGADDATLWTRSVVGDAEGSVASSGGAVGSPGRSTRATVAFDPCAPEPEPVGEMRITEWMYKGSGGELVELTNVGDGPVDLAGWRYHDSGANPAAGFDLSGFGVVAAGESVVLTEDAAATFRSAWDLCAEVKVVGGSNPGLGRQDQINIYDADGAVVDTLTYGDDTVGGPRTDGASAWVSAAGLGTDTVAEWTLSTVGDGEGSVVSSNGDVGSPGRSTRATVAFDPCQPVGGDGQPTITVDRTTVVGSIGDPTNPTVTVTVTDPDTAVESLVVTAQSSNGSVLPVAGVTATGTGAERVVSFAPTGRGTSTVTLTVTDPEHHPASATVAYAASNQAPDASGRYHHQISDASSALSVGDGYMLLVNDETNTIFLHAEEASGAPVKTWSFTSQQLGSGSEIDFESIARAGDTLVVSGSHGNSRTGGTKPERRHLFAMTITGSGAATELTYQGRYSSLWDQLRTWDHTDGHGLGADALGFVAGTAGGVLPNPPAGFNIEGLEFAPDGTTGYLGFRAPTIGPDDDALIVPVTNLLDLPTGVPGTTPATFGAPILLDLDGRSIREIRRNDHGEYLISAGPSPANNSWALYTWDGEPGNQPAFNRTLPAEDALTGGTWESIASVPHPLEAGAQVRLVTDSGDTNFYGTGATKDLSPALQKSYSQLITLDDVPAPPEGDFVLTLLHANDAESKLLPAGDYGGAARFTSLVDQLRADAATEAGPAGAGRGTVTISSGDNFLAGPNFAASLSLPVGTPFYDATFADHVGYDAMVLGNHEFDLGPDVLARFIEGTTDVPFLSANLDVTNVPSLEALRAEGRIAPWTVVDKGGEQIGIIGATTEGLASISTPGDVVINQVLPAVQDAVTALEDLGVDKIVLASHLQDINNELALVAQLRGVDIVISGGGDELLGDPATDPIIPGETPVGDYPRIVADASGTDVPVVTTAGDLKYVGRLKVRFDAAGHLVEVYEPQSQPIRVSGLADDPVAVTPDAAVAAEVEAPITAYTAGLAGNVIAQTEVPLDSRNPQPIRRFESNYGNLIADSLLWQADQLAASVGAPAPDIGLQNGGGIRNNSVVAPDAAPGSPQPITELDTFNALAFSNYVSIVPGVTPQQLKGLLEHAVSGVPTDGGTTGGGQWGNWAGLRFTWTPAGTAQTVDVATNSVATPGSRIIDVVLDDGTVLFDDGVEAPTARPVNLATIDFTARGGDDYPFAGTSLVNVGASYQQALFNYLTAPTGLDGHVSAQRYPNLGQVVPQGQPDIGDNPAHRRIVEAAGFPAHEPNLDLSRTTVSFGDQLVGTVSAPQGVTVTNAGTAPLTVTGATATGAFAVDVTDCTAAVLPVGATCEVAITFAPTAPGAQESTVTITSDDATSPHTVTVTGTGQAVVAPPEFTDVPADHLFADDIAWLAGSGVTEGFADGSFGPTLPVARQSMAAFLFRFANPGADKPSCAVAPFVDVAVDDPFCGEIAWLAGSGVTEGFADGTFGPTLSVARQSMAAFLFRFANPGADKPSCAVAPFVDVAVDDPFCGEIAWLAGSGIVQGYEDGSFGPTAPVARQSMAAFLHRLSLR